MQPAPKSRDKIKVVDVVVSTNHVTFLANRFPRLISLPTSAIFVSGTSGITAISKYRRVNPVVSVGRVNSLPDQLINLFILFLFYFVKLSFSYLDCLHIIRIFGGRENI